jgi:carbon storage regulator
MLVLSRKVGEKVYIGKDIVVTLVENNGRGQIRLGVEAPRDVLVLRQELLTPNDIQGKGGDSLSSL